MRLLVINFAMDRTSPVLAWQEKVTYELAATVRRVVVLTESAGEFRPAPNMEVRVIPRILRRAPLRWFKAKWLMLPYVYALCRREKFDACFIHMAHEWAYRFSAAFRRFDVPVLLWYAHGSVTPGLVRALRCVDRLVTSTPEGCRVASPKVRVIGQAIDTSLFQLPVSGQVRNVLLYVGRITPRKRIHLLIEVMQALRASAGGGAFRLKLVGPASGSADQVYLLGLQARVAEMGLQDIVEFCGPREQSQLPPLYETALLHINLSETGSMDKTVMESLAAGCPVLTSNEAIMPLLGVDFPGMIVYDSRPEAVAGQVMDIAENRHRFTPERLRALVVGLHDLDGYVRKILLNLREIIAARAGQQSFNNP